MKTKYWITHYKVKPECSRLPVLYAALILLHVKENGSNDESQKQRHCDLINTFIVNRYVIYIYIYIYYIYIYIAAVNVLNVWSNTCWSLKGAFTHPGKRKLRCLIFFKQSMICCHQSSHNASVLTQACQHNVVAVTSPRENLTFVSRGASSVKLK